MYCVECPGLSSEHVRRNPRLLGVNAVVLIGPALNVLWHATPVSGGCRLRVVTAAAESASQCRNCMGPKRESE